MRYQNSGSDLKTNYLRMKKIYQWLNNFLFIKGGESFDITIIDDVFPFHISPWRNIDYLNLAKHFKVKIYCDKPQSNKAIPGKKTFESLSTDFEEHYPNHNINYKELNLFSPLNSKIVYLLFFNYVHRYYKHLKKHNQPFVFTLYAGGGFQVNNPEIDKFLKEVFSDKLFKGCIVNQKFIYNYLINKKLIHPDKLLYSIGPTNIDFLFNKINDINKLYYRKNKKTFDIIFASNKYMPYALDKGYDVFIETAWALIQKYDFIRFHVVGPFTDNEIIYQDLKPYVTYYGYQDEEFLIDLFQKMDVNMIPCRPFVAQPGHFDGFPTGISLISALTNVVMLITDFLNENDFLEDGKDFFCINKGIENIIKIIESLIESPEKLISIGNSGKRKFIERFKNDSLDQRTEFFKKIIEEI